MRILLLICLLLLTGCDSADTFNKTIIEMDKNCDGPTKVKIHYGNLLRYIEVSCDDINEIN